MKKVLLVVLSIAVLLLLSVSAFAVGPGKKVEFDGKGAGKVVFEGAKHSSAKCAECHPGVFKMKKGAAVMTMKDMEAGKSCGVCHNGTKAFSAKECAKCHKK
jgi:c(7)-type cytochrome triheme protein